MIDEVEEFRAYTGVVNYTARNKHDATYLGRFTYGMLMDFEGMARVLTILARGYMYSNPMEPDVDRARRALCAWCSVPDSKKASPKEDWQFHTEFSDLHGEFPELIDELGLGWLCSHVRNICAFVEAHPETTSKKAQENCRVLKKGFEEQWRKKVVQYQTPVFSEGPKYSWILHFDDALADALELGPLRQPEISFPPDLLQRIEELSPKGVPPKVLQTLIAYYIVNRPEDSDWVVLPVSNFDAYFGTISFSHRWLAILPEEIVMREKQSFGICRFQACREWMKNISVENSNLYLGQMGTLH